MRALGTRLARIISLAATPGGRGVAACAARPQRRCASAAAAAGVAPRSQQWRSAAAALAGGAAPRRRAVATAATAAGGASFDASAAPLLLERRAALVARAPRQILHIRGVSFGDDRQAAVAALAPGRPVMFARTPSNPADARAVAIKALDGALLGWVSRDATAAFPLQTCFGVVAHVGQAPSGTWGALVAVCPALHGLRLDALPASWARRADLSAAYGADGRARLQARARARYSERCAVTGAHSSEVPLVVVPQWGFDAGARRAWLERLLPVAQPLAQLQQLLMQWSDEDVRSYLGHVAAQQRDAEQQGWALDLPLEAAVDAGALAPPPPQQAGGAAA
ncbi:hypothetical protein HT031_002271 [Scenedesmus sp. PABB004]|nr:hypothetical protein HT031_002271 [Scenedesmus sp. PABB004]